MNKPKAQWLNKIYFDIKDFLSHVILCETIFYICFYIVIGNFICL